MPKKKKPPHPPKNSNAVRGPATLGPHRSCVPAQPLSPRRRRHDYSSPSALSLFRTKAPRWLKPVADLQSCDHEPATVAAASSPFLLRRARLGRRPQRPGNQSRCRAFLDVPSANPLSESPAAAGSAAIIRPSQEPSRFAALTVGHLLLPRNTKSKHDCEEAVDVETSLWKP